MKKLIILIFFNLFNLYYLHYKNQKISVIVPIYNTYKYITDCLNSLTKQTLKEIEIILINDGSNNRTIKKINPYLNDKRIILINQNHKGISVTRNNGLEFSNGEYISFVDSDDYIEYNAYEILYNLAKKDNLDIIEFKHISFSDKRNQKLIENDINQKGEINYNIKKHWNKMRIELWNKIYKSEIIKKNNIKFIPDLYGEDLCFNYMIIPRIKKFKIINMTFYHYRLRFGQITGKLNIYEKWEKMRNMINIIPDFWRKNNLIKGNELWLLEMMIFIFIKRGKSRFNFQKDFLYLLDNQIDFFNKKTINKLNEYYYNELINNINTNFLVYLIFYNILID